jgi:hypothetical protein
VTDDAFEDSRLGKGALEKDGGWRQLVVDISVQRRRSDTMPDGTMSAA